MKEKKTIRISLTTFFLIIAIMVIGIVGFLAYKFYNEKNIESQKVANLNSEIGALESTVNNLKDNLDKVSSTGNDGINKNSNKLDEKDENTTNILNIK